MKVMPMLLLPKVLNDLKIKSLKDFNRFMEDRQPGALKIVTPDGMQTGFSDYAVKENEVHGDCIELSGLVLDVPALTLYPKVGLMLKNCIFTGKVSINGKDHDGSSAIEIENCIFLQELTISGFSKMVKRNVSIFHSNAANLSLFNIKSSEMILTGCRVFFLSLHEIESAKFEAENNCFKHFEIESGKFKEVVFDHRQIDIESIGRRIVKGLGAFRFKTYNELYQNLNLFSFIPYKSSEDLKRSQAYNTMIETIHFYKHSTSLSFDRHKYMKLVFYEVLLAQDKPFQKAFVWITGGFLKPYRFIMMALTVLLFFSGLYMFPSLEFHSGNTVYHSLTLGRALYFSGVTFATIGYGDITPVGVSRLLAVLEGLLGILIMSSFLVAVVKKYID
jgi:hypothetical protein